MAPVEYRERPVPAPLRRWVAAAWEVRAHAVGPNSVAFLSPVTAGRPCAASV